MNTNLILEIEGVFSSLLSLFSHQTLGLIAKQTHIFQILMSISQLSL
jgi:hypothetical protein